MLDIFRIGKNKRWNCYVVENSFTLSLTLECVISPNITRDFSIANLKMHSSILYLYLVKIFVPNSEKIRGRYIDTYIKVVN